MNYVTAMLEAHAMAASLGKDVVVFTVTDEHPQAFYITSVQQMLKLDNVELVELVKPNSAGRIPVPSLN